MRLILILCCRHLRLGIAHELFEVGDYGSLLAPENHCNKSSHVVLLVFSSPSNAVKFTDEGSITVKVQLRPMPPPELASDNQEIVAVFAPADRMAIHIEVTDTGRGIPPGGEEHLFKPFSQLQTDSGGTGLGLVSVKTKVEMLGGSVGVQRNEPSTCQVCWELAGRARPLT